MNGESLTILLVEDNEDHAEIVFRTFKTHRISNKLFHVDDGEKALNYLFEKNEYSDKTKYPTPNIILLDLRLPKIDGIEVLRNIKNDDKLKQIPVIILTSSDAEADVTKAYTNSVNSYIVKPLEYDKFVKLMENLGYYWLIWNKAPF
ncbi:response regulator [Candidatus Dependentiae bacterium]|nr:response regulator [Candidatus Dependentiae bacterium]